MILREFEGGLDLIRQHDHGQVSGDFAAHWAERLPPSVLLAIGCHDIGWETLDNRVAWNRSTERPYSFMDYPLKEKTEAYRWGIDWVEERDLYAAFLCSRHYTSFFEGARGKVARQFLDAEQKRQERLERELDRQTRSRQESDLQLLKLCDDLSLFLCLNLPGENRHPWYRDGFRYRGRRLIPRWEGSNTIYIDPDPFRASFTVRIPFQRLTVSGEAVGGGTDVVTIRNSKEISDTSL